MKIALAGAGGVGKGTLGKLIADHYGIPFLPSHIKDTGIAMGLNTGYNDNVSSEIQFAFQNAILFGQIYQERAINIANLGYIAERSTLDYIPYYTNRGFDVTDDDIYLSIARNWAKETYDCIIFVPQEFEAKDLDKNSWKERDKAQQSRTERIIKEELVRAGNNTLHVSGTPEERFEQVIRHFSAYDIY